MVFDLNDLGMFVSFALSISGFLIAAASFIVGLYIQKYDDFESKDDLLPYQVLISSLIISSGVAMFLATFVVLSSTQPFFTKLLLTIFLLSPIIPIVAIICILIWHVHRGFSNG